MIDFALNGVLKNDLCTMVSDVPMSEQTSERSGVQWSGAEWSEAERNGAQRSRALRSERVSERVALLNDAVFSIIYHSGVVQ